MATGPRFSSKQEYEAWKDRRQSGAPPPLMRPLGVRTVKPGRPAASPAGRAVRSTAGRTNVDLERPLRRVAAGVVLLVVTVLGICWMRYQNDTVDPRCSIQAVGEHRSKLARFVNRSKLWKAYLNDVAPDKNASAPVAGLSLVIERIRLKGRGGDYDPGSVNVVFTATNLRTGGNLYEKTTAVALDPFIIGLFDKNASRDEIQEIAFKSTEDKIFPYLNTWVEVSAVRAMGQEGAQGISFVPFLEKIVEETWSGDVKAEARKALQAIQTSQSRIKRVLPAEALAAPAS